MSAKEIVDLSSDDEGGNVGPGAVSTAKQQNQIHKGQLTRHQRSQSHSTGKVSEVNISSSSQNTCHSYSGVLERGFFPVDDTGLSYSSPSCVTPLCRTFWKAGNYDNGLGSKVRIQNVENHLYVHPMFLHSNATSHTWAFGAVAELLDNAVDEVIFSHV
ncbi:hypothetical protein SESBI_02859 [Sesbania bispinosa]|nr:hypothetical protein SESBI_02859 [Sesbania bispinosa]